MLNVVHKGRTSDNGEETKEEKILHYFSSRAEWRKASYLYWLRFNLGGRLTRKFLKSQGLTYHVYRNMMHKYERFMNQRFYR